ncbi:uncharacterized protein [Palaemon carinicauda]|uniref:uncharacterized protein n=1 Tax=Palaemon carinicauda TaxID=392227 RepID=UPI0035B663D7
MYIIRGVRNQSTGMSPFELLFGRRPRTILSSVKERILKLGDNEVPLSQYISELNKKLSDLHSIAKTNLITAQEKMKINYDKKAKTRSFKVGDAVLLYHPLAGSPLREKYQGPYTITQRISPTNYIIATPDKHKPGRCTMLDHDIKLQPGAAPIKQAFYRTSQKKLGIMKEENSRNGKKERQEVKEIARHESEDARHAKKMEAREIARWEEREGEKAGWEERVESTWQDCQRVEPEKINSAQFRGTGTVECSCKVVNSNSCDPCFARSRVECGDYTEIYREIH